MTLQLNGQKLADFTNYLTLQERSIGTIQKYRCDLEKLRRFAGEEITDKAVLIAFKEHLIRQGYADVSINSFLAAVNQYLKYMGFAAWQLRFLKIQRQTFRSAEKELTTQEYQRLVEAARQQGNKRLALLAQTIAATGIRVSELRGITVEAVRKGQARICMKGKTRQILLPRELCNKLLSYCEKKRIHTGQIFITRTGKPLDRSNIWRMLKKLAPTAKVKAKKVFPHNLRHLFAVTYYKRYKDVVRLADILGHSSIDTTRIYTARSGKVKQKFKNLFLYNTSDICIKKMFFLFVSTVLLYRWSFLLQLTVGKRLFLFVLDFFAIMAGKWALNKKSIIFTVLLW